MTTLKTSELIDDALDWAVCVALGRTDMRIDPDDGEMLASDDFDYSTEWSHGGPIIEREKINMIYRQAINRMNLKISSLWIASVVTHGAEGPTPLIAAMRCFVASKLGDTVDVPPELV